MFRSRLACWACMLVFIFSVSPAYAQDDNPFAVVFDSPAIETSGRVVIEQEGPCFDFPGGRSCELKLAGVSIQKHGKNISLFQSNIVISPADNDEYLAISGLGIDESFGIRAFIPGGGCIDNTEIPDRDKFREILSKAQIFVICDEDDDPSPGTAEIEGSTLEHFIFDLPKIDFGIVPIGFVHFRQITGRNVSQQARTILLTDAQGEFSALEDLGDGVRGEPIEVLEVPPGDPFSFYGAFRPNQFSLNRQIVLSELEQDRLINYLIEGSSPSPSPLNDPLIQSDYADAINISNVAAATLGDFADINLDLDVTALDALNVINYIGLDVPEEFEVEPLDALICINQLSRHDFQINQPFDPEVVETNLRCWTGDFLKPVVIKKKVTEKEENLEIGVRVITVDIEGELRLLDIIRKEISIGELRDARILRRRFEEILFIASDGVMSIEAAADSFAGDSIMSLNLSGHNDPPPISYPIDVEVSTSSGDPVEVRTIDDLNSPPDNKGLDDPSEARGWTWTYEEGVDYVITLTNLSDEPLKAELRFFPLSDLQGDALFLPGDCNRDSSLNMADAICLLSHLFLGDPNRLPCGEGPVDDPANVALFDLNGQAGVDASDAIHLLVHLFLGGAGPVQGMECIPAPGCPNDCG